MRGLMGDFAFSFLFFSFFVFLFDREKLHQTHHSHVTQVKLEVKE